MADTERLGRHRQEPPTATGPANRQRRVWLIATIGCAVLVAVALVFVVPVVQGKPGATSGGIGSFTLPTKPDSYLGWYPSGVPASYAGVTALTAAIGVKPSVVPYYSGWLEPFQPGFAKTVADNGAVLLVQMDPKNISIGAIAAGRYDSYLRTYADNVHAYRHPVILSFGHEMNGYWYSWSYKQTKPAVFVAAWRHIVTLFRQRGVDNVTWMWTVNIIDDPYYGEIHNPSPWWPGKSYVTWVGIDGYYYHPSTTFTSLFGPTIAAVREITTAPILISETSIAPAAGQSAKITDLFAGIHLYGLLGLVWFDVPHPEDWRLTNPAAIAEFRQEARKYKGASS